ncbi:MAG: SRPBCC family protein [Gemmataceae bacterium]|nr:SRPBCC family protein [Gemmataceae bacterium]
MRVRTLNVEMWLPRPIDEVFPFFADAGNLDAITPPWLHFHIVTPRPIDMKAGALIDYKLRVRGIPITWRTEITHWEPPYRFVDRQLKGPYRQWIHEHTFEEKDGGTIIRDKIDYAAPGWLLEPIIHGLFVGPDVRKIFAYRQEKIRELLLAPQPA